MKKAIWLCFCWLIGFAGFAQQIHWANKVIRVTSESGRGVYSAQQALGKPNHFSGPTPCAWQPGTPDGGEEFIQVAFDTLMPIRQIVVVENLGAGSIQQITGFDEKGAEYLFVTNNTLPGTEGKVWSFVLNEPIKFRLTSLKILLNTSRVKGFNQIDAIGISSEAKAYQPTITLVPQSPQPIVKENMGAGINSIAKELNPIISPDGKTLFFTRWGHPENMGEAVPESDKLLKRQDIWYSELVNGKWQKALNIGAPLNNNSHNSICSISADGKTVLLLNQYNPDGSMSFGISTSEKTSTGWTNPKPVIIDNLNLIQDLSGSFTEYALSEDKRTLVMALRRMDSYGDRDLYVSFLQSNGHWSTPKNLGKTVNTADEEGSPYLAPDGKTLYFSTEGWPGYGNKDIFMTRRLDVTWQHWSEPQNLGQPINTAGWDGYFTIPASGDYAYLCSDQNSLGEEDIFRVKTNEAFRPEPVVLLSGLVLNANTQKPVAADVFSVSLTGTRDSLSTDYNPQTGEYKFILPLKNLYAITAQLKGYLPVHEEIDLKTEKRYREIRKNLLLVPIEVGSRIVLNTVYFRQSRAEIDSSSEGELNRLVTIMKENPAMEIKLEGHTDNQGDFDANIKLSTDRVKNVKAYLVEHGIDTTRIQYQGFGSTRPIASNYSEENRRKNRRVEFTVTKV
ncbi:MAG: OmpA family protein [Siphonobacter sp.]